MRGDAPDNTNYLLFGVDHCQIIPCDEDPNWRGKGSITCSGFGTYCQNYTYVPGYEYMFGAINNFPDSNCCNCGKGRNPPYLQAPNKTIDAPDSCTHKKENDKSEIIVEFCKN